MLSSLLQHSVLDKKRDRETQEEEELYEQVLTLESMVLWEKGGGVQLFADSSVCDYFLQIKHYNMPELQAEEKFEDFLRRTSDYQYLKATKLRREREIDASRTGGGLMGLALTPSASPRVCSH